MNEFTRRTRDKNNKEGVQNLCGILHLRMAGERAAKTEWSFRAKSRGPCRPDMVTTGLYP